MSVADGLRLEQVKIDHFAGVDIRNAFEVSDLSPGFNLVYGENGCGKTTLARAMMELMWPNRKRGERTIIRGNLAVRGTRWTVDLTDVGSRCDTAESDATWSGFPEDLRRSVFWALKDLMSEHDQSLAEQIAGEMEGGVRLTDLRDSLGIEMHPRTYDKHRKDLRDTEAQLRQQTQIQRSLEEEQQRSINLFGQSEADEALDAELQFIQDLLELRAVEKERASLQNRLNDFPATIATFRPEDAPHARTWLRRQTEYAREEEHVKTDLERLQQSAPRWADVSDEELRRVQTESLALLQQLRESSTALQQSSAALRDEESHIQDLRLRLQSPEDEMLLVPDGYAFPELREYVRTVLAADAVEERARQAERTLAGMEDPDDLPWVVDELRDGIRLLNRWIAFEPPENPTQLTSPIVLSTLMSAISIGLLAALVHPIWTTGLVAPGLFWVWHRRLSGLGEQMDLRRESLQKDVERLRIPHPEKWTVSDVQGCIEQCGRDALVLQRAGARTEQEHLLQELRRETDALREKLQTSEDSLAHTNGFQAKVDSHWIAHALSDIQALRQRQSNASALRMETERLHALQSELLSHLSRRWSPFDLTAGKSEAEASARWSELQSLTQNEAVRRRDLAARRDQLKSIQRQIILGNEDLATLADRMGVEELDEGVVATFENAYPEWEPLFRRSEALLHRVSDLRKRIPEGLDYAGEDETALRGRQGELEADRVRRAERRDAALRLEEKIALTKQQLNIESLLKVQERQRAALMDDRQECVEALVADALVDWMREHVLQRERPQIFDDANWLLGRFTNGGLELEVSTDGEQERFLARRGDLVAQELDELSAGERVQVLMAVRLAYLRQAEPMSLPLFVDEALSTSDAYRAESVMDHLADICEQGRQVFYFTAQVDEVKKWRQVLERRGVEHKLIALDELRRGQKTVEHPLPEETDRPVSLPDPQRGEDARAWARRVGIPAWVPGEEMARTHCWHVARDPATTVRLVASGVLSVTAFSRQCEIGGLEWVETEIQDAARKRVELLARGRSLWLEGRPPKVGFDVLLASGAVSEKFAGMAAALLAQVDGDAATFLAQLDEKAIPGWRKNKTEQLREIFGSGSFLTDAIPLSSEEWNARMLLALEQIDPSHSLDPIEVQEWRQVYFGTTKTSQAQPELF